VNYAREMGFNSVVVDFKDDQGLLRYNSELPVAIEADTIRPLFDARELISKFHEAGIYVIGRLVVFKDKGLYAYDNNRYALWDERLNQPWESTGNEPRKPPKRTPSPSPIGNRLSSGWIPIPASFGIIISPLPGNGESGSG
jgi:hypothetical protein